MFSKIVIASDSFKGSLSSAEVGKAAAEGIGKACPGCRTVVLPVADGGEGTSAILTQALGGKMKKVTVSDPIGRRIEAEYGIVGNETAIIELAAASGLILLSDDERNPLLTSTYGTGEMMTDAYSEGCRKFLIGIGGSATNDGGTGMLEALGFRFIDKDGNTIRGCRGDRLSSICDIDDSNVHEMVRNADFTTAFDVTTPFFGKDGATMTFSAQKGADKEMMQTLEEGMRSFAGVIARKYGIRIEDIKGSGAAGGAGGALAVFLGSGMKSGIDMVLDTVDFDGMVRDADLVITGEGRIDGQSRKGKVIYGILQRAQAYGIPVIAICGMKGEGTDTQETGFASVLPIAEPPADENGLRRAMHPETAYNNISATVAKALEELFPSSCRGSL